MWLWCKQVVTGRFVLTRMRKREVIKISFYQISFFCLVLTRKKEFTNRKTGDELCLFPLARHYVHMLCPEVILRIILFTQNSITPTHASSAGTQTVLQPTFSAPLRRLKRNIGVRPVWHMSECLHLH